MRAVFLALYRRVFARRVFYRLNLLVHGLSLRGIGILNYQDSQASGEASFLKRLARHSPPMVVLDVGANVGEFSCLVKCVSPAALVYAFEPHPQTFLKLQAAAAAHGFKAMHLALDQSAGRVTLYDYAGCPSGSEHASLSREVIETCHGGEAIGREVEATTVDRFVDEKCLSMVHLLKVDTEGNELAVLKGAVVSIRRGILPVVQFEFNEMNIATRVWFRDFWDLLPDYAFYRMLPDALVPLGEYNPVVYEVFAYQNIVAIRKDCPYYERLLND